MKNCLCFLLGTMFGVSSCILMDKYKEPMKDMVNSIKKDS